jgi:hypothetical protein
MENDCITRDTDHHRLLTNGTLFIRADQLTAELKLYLLFYTVLKWTFLVWIIARVLVTEQNKL